MHEISTYNSITKTLIWSRATTRRIPRLFTGSLPETVLVTLGFDPHLAPGAQDVVRWRRTSPPQLPQTTTTTTTTTTITSITATATTVIIATATAVITNITTTDVVIVTIIIYCSYYCYYYFCYYCF